MMKKSVTPYAFEPRRSTDEKQKTKSKENTVPISGTLEIEDWCLCGNCEVMPNPVENVCCHDYTAVLEKMSLYDEHQGHTIDEEIQCITEHQGFDNNCLSIYVLEKDLIRARLEKTTEETTIDETYRHLAYTGFTMWVHGSLGKGVRKVVPACAVKKIRECFPEGPYFKGFLPYMDPQV